MLPTCGVHIILENFFQAQGDPKIFTYPEGCSTLTLELRNSASGSLAASAMYSAIAFGMNSSSAPRKQTHSPLASTSPLFQASYIPESGSLLHSATSSSYRPSDSTVPSVDPPSMMICSILG